MGRDKRNETREHWTKLVRPMLQTPAWRALGTSAQALDPWLKFEWHGRENNNNGKIRLSVRQAAQCVGVGRNAAARAFHDLQAKGFIVMTEMPRLGFTGEAKSPAFELTEIPLPHGDKPEGRKLFREWSDGHDFPVQRVRPNNPRGVNRKTKPCHQNDDNPVIEMMTFQERASSK